MDEPSLRELMQSQGWTVEDVAQLIRKPMQTVYRYLADEQSIPGHVRFNLSALAQRGQNSP